MPSNYNVVFGAFVRVYGGTTFEANNDAEAIEKAKQVFKAGDYTFEDHDWNNLALPAIVSLEREGTVREYDETVLEGEEFAATLEDARDMRASAMVEMLTKVRAWVNDECERRGDEDQEYAEPAASIVKEIDALLELTKKVDV